MKRITSLVVIAFCCINFLQAQYYPSLEKRWQAGISINTPEPSYDFVLVYRNLNGHRSVRSYCAGAHIAYTIKENLVLRFSAKLTKQNVEETADTRETYPFNNDYEIDTVNARQTIKIFTMGLLYAYNYKKLNFYGGGQMIYKHYGLLSGNTVVVRRETITNKTLSYIRVYSTLSGGFSLGMASVMGFNVNICSYFSAGTEFSVDYSYGEYGGEGSFTKTNIFLNSSDPPQKIYQIYKGFSFSPLQTSVYVVYNF